MLILALFAVIQGLTGVNLTQIASIIGMVYCAWAIGQFFNSKKIGTYFKSFSAYILGMISFFLFATLIGIVIDLLVKH